MHAIYRRRQNRPVGQQRTTKRKGRLLFQKVVNLDPSDGFAQVHLAFAKKMIADKSKKDEDYESCLEPFKIGVERE